MWYTPAFNVVVYCMCFTWTILLFSSGYFRKDQYKPPAGFDTVSKTLTTSMAKKSLLQCIYIFLLLKMILNQFKIS